MNEKGDASFDPLDLDAQDSAKAATAEEERLRTEQDADDLRHVLGTKQGRRFVWRLMAEAGVFNSSFSESAALMSFNEGRRSRGLALLDELFKHSPNSYPQMVAEQKSLRDRYAQRKRTST